jgi:sugar porter (SP) family MFS transporter
MHIETNVASAGSPATGSRNLFDISLIAALAGFIFVFDTVVISGANQPIKDIWHTTEISPWFHGFFIMSMALWGTVVGAIFGGIPTQKYGRKKVLLWIGVLFSVSAIGSAIAPDPYTFSFFRFIGGIGIGVSSVAAPTYVSEISTPATRGRLVAMYQFNIVFGILIAFLSNYFLQGVGGINDWRWMLGVMVVPADLFYILLRTIPESPRWLIMKKGKIEEARAIFKIIDPKTADRIVEEISATDKEEKEVLQQDPLFSKRYKTPVMLAILFAVFNQVSGINAIIYYSPRIFEMTGLGSSSSLLSTVGLGIINFTFTLLAMNFIDRIGRKTLMLIGSFGLIFTLALVSYSFYAESFNGWSVPVFLFIYIAFFAFSQGAVIWVFISEIFPNQVRAKGQTLGSTTHWIMAAAIAFSFPYLAEKAGGGNTFLFFCIMMCIQLVFVWKIMPETK